jgi:hypothetical protein
MTIVYACRHTSRKGPVEPVVHRRMRCPRCRGKKKARAVITIFLSLLCLLSLSTKAAADCAWVLWGAQRPHEGTADAKSWWVLAAYPTRAECESRRAAVHRQRTSNEVSFECLPDTVDPRGPKGK